MIKNLGKLKQWTGERFGGAKVTLQTEDFQRLEHETELRREGYDNVVEATTMIHSHLLKRKVSPEDNKSKVMPFEALGSCLYHYGTVFSDDSALGIALINLGQTETRLAALQEALANEIKMGYMTTLANGLQDYKEYDSLRKKLASRRLDYDSKLNRLNKAKKEKPELEQEMQAARIKYEDTEHDLIQKMAYMQEFENEHRDALLDLVEAQCTYHTQAKELLETLKNNWGQGSSTDARDFMGQMIARKSSVESYHSDNATSHYHVTPANSVTKSSIGMSRDSSLDTFSSSSVNLRNNSTEPLPTNNNASLSLVHQSAPSISNHEHEKFRKAMFDFTGQNNDEISFKTGDIIAVINEIDKGWWLGELNSERGIFPVNYTEDYDPQAHPLPPIPDNTTREIAQNPKLEEKPRSEPQPELNGSSSSTRTISHQQSNPHMADAYQSDSASSVGSASTRRLPPPLATASSTATTRPHSTLGRKGSTAIRAPPPPPPSAILVHNLETHANSANTGMIESPHSFRPSLDEPSFSSVNTSAVSVGSHHHDPPQSINKPCVQCECHDFIENLFKKGYCNNCFHKHDD